MPLLWSASRVLTANNASFAYVRRGTGNYTQCVADVRHLLDKGGGCATPPCALTAVRTPADLSRMQLYGFSEYWYSQHDILALRGAYNESLLAEAATAFCATRWEVILERASKNVYPRADTARLL